MVVLVGKADKEKIKQRVAHHTDFMQGERDQFRSALMELSSSLKASTNELKEIKGKYRSAVEAEAFLNLKLLEAKKINMTLVYENQRLKQGSVPVPLIKN
jgi:hypothetical protein